MVIQTTIDTIPYMHNFSSSPTLNNNHFSTNNKSIHHLVNHTKNNNNSNRNCSHKNSKNSRI